MPSFSTMVELPHVPPSSPTWDGDTIDHADAVQKPVMSLTPRYSWARDAINSAPFPSLWCRWPHAISKPATPSSSSSLWRCHPYNVLESMTPLTPHCPWARNTTLYIFLCHFVPTNPKFDTLHCHIALICYIDFVLWRCFDMLYCHIALICYLAMLLWYATHCYIAFVLLHFDLYEYILHCSMMKVG
jgi:hypothetical protein